MSLSSVCVVANALRLNLFKLYDPSRDRKRKKSPAAKGQEEPAAVTLQIQGMMCGHCEAAVKQALESLEGTECLSVSHETRNRRGKNPLRPPAQRPEKGSGKSRLQSIGYQTPTIHEELKAHGRQNPS